MTAPKRRNRMLRPATAGSVLSGLTRQMGVQERLEQYRVWRVWAEVVGPQTALHAQPQRLRGNVLEVLVDHPVWMQQLQLLKPQILDRLNRAIAPAVLSDLLWRHGRPEPLPSDLSPVAPEPSPLSPQEERQVDRILPPDDDDLHQAWRRLLARHVKSKAENWIKPA